MDRRHDLRLALLALAVLAGFALHRAEARDMADGDGRVEPVEAS